MKSLNKLFHKCELDDSQPVSYTHLPVEAGYDFIGANLVPYVDYAIPFGCLRRIALMNLSENSLTYSALAGFLQSIGLAPDRYLEGMLEE